MPRIIIHKAKGPKEVKVGEKSVWICRCGLSQNQPFCDGSHKMTQDEEEGKLYKYTQEKRERKTVVPDTFEDAYSI